MHYKNEKNIEFLFYLSQNMLMSSISILLNLVNYMNQISYCKKICTSSQNLYT